MRRLLLVFMVVLVSVALYSANQPDDTFLKTINGLAPEQKVQQLLKLLETHADLPFDILIDYAETGLQWANQSNNEKDKAQLYNFLGNEYYLAGKLDQSIANYQEALRITMRVGEKDEMANLMQKLGIINYNRDDLKKALLYFQQTLKIYQDLGYMVKEADMYTSIGNIYFKWNQYENALENFELAFGIYYNIDNIPAKAQVLYLKSFTLQKLGQYDQAIQWFDEAVDANLLLGNQNEIAHIFNAIGETYMLSGQYELALQEFIMAYNIQKQISDSVTLAQSMNNLGNVYKQIGQFSVSEKYLNQSITMANNLGLKKILMDNYESFYELYYVQNKSKQALQYYQLYVTLHDSLFNSQSNSNNEIKSAINNDALVLTKKLFEQQRSHKIQLAVLFVILLILFIMLFYQRSKIVRLTLKIRDIAIPKEE